MRFSDMVNGMAVDAFYSDESVERIFVPLLRRMKAMQAAKGARVLVMLAAPPGAGKTTLCHFLKYLSETVEGLSPITVIGMDGFHRYQDYLVSHTTERDGEIIPMVKIKGAPITFDLPLLKARIEKVASGATVGWPEYNRMTHNPEEDAVTVAGDIVLLEGNYLLLDEEGWRDLAALADYTIRIDADIEDLRTRLVDRKEKSGSGSTHEAAVQFVEYSDLHNARECLTKSLPADLVLSLHSDDTYTAAE